MFKKKCKHTNNKTITNLSDSINKSIRVCQDCKEIFFSKKYDHKCNVINFNINERSNLKNEKNTHISS